MKKLVIRDLAELGVALRTAVVRDCEHPFDRLVAAPASSPSASRACGVCGQVLLWWQVEAVTPEIAPRVYQERRTAIGPSGDLPPCPCGKRSYPDRASAERQSAGLTEIDGRKSTRAYSCALGLPVWHLKSVVRSRRQSAGSAP